MNYTESNLSMGFIPKKPRSGCRDIWNACLVEGAEYSLHDIPYCPTFIPNGPPESLLSFPKAQTLYHKEVKAGNHDFHSDAFIHFYCDDYLFDNPRKGIWVLPQKTISFLKHFGGIITPDFSTYTDFPDPLKRYNTYRMRAFGYACYRQGIPVINNVRWGTKETWDYCFDGISPNSTICIGTNASGQRELENRFDCSIGFEQMLHTLSPKTILVYGSDRYSFLNSVDLQKTKIVTFPSETNLAFHKEGKYE